MAHPLEFLVEHYAEREAAGGIVMVANIASLRPTWIPLTEYMDLRRATVQEARDLQRLYELYINTWTHRRNPFETRAIVSTTAQGWHAQHVPLAEHELRYHVIEYRGVNGQVRDLRSASALTERELHLGMEIDFGRTVGMGATRGIDTEDFVGSCSFDDDAFESWDIQHAADLADTYRRWTKHEEGVIALRKATESYIALRGVRRNPNLLFLGLFTMLEALLTIDDHRTGHRDTLRNQVVNKIALLEKRFVRPLPYNLFRDTNAGPSTIWGKLYTVRSTLAHGRTPDFSARSAQKAKPDPDIGARAVRRARAEKHTSKKRGAPATNPEIAEPDSRKSMETLVDLKTCEIFVRAALKSVMRCALDEPQLVADLQRC
jgi:hypothetical protein